MTDLIFGITLFTALVMVLTSIILIVRTRLFPTDEVHIRINADKVVTTNSGRKLLDVLSDAGLFLPSACGGRGTCGQCKVAVDSGGGAVLPTEASLLTKTDVAAHARLACQVVVKRDLDITLRPEIFGVRKWNCAVRTTNNVSTFIRELVLDLPAGEVMPIQAGSYVIVECPAYEASFKDFEIEATYRNEWDRHDLWRFAVRTVKQVTRAYSLANYPDESDIVMLNVRIALPPPGSDPAVPPGIVSSYLFSLRPGDPVTVSGPYGEFVAHNTDREMVFIGGGAGMAPMRSHILDQLLRIKSSRKISFWYGARSRQELFYTDVFADLAKEHANFDSYVALSDPLSEDNWTGFTGLIHKVVYDNYLKRHAAPEQCEYYVCGPPLMNIAVLKMLEDLGVEREDVMLDDFGN